MSTSSIESSEQFPEPPRSRWQHIREGIYAAAAIAAVVDLVAKGVPWLMQFVS
ncbi:hypothetical protein SAMN04244553_5373 [Nocardia amikacinitolerans]|uniref:Uncharacterized protein n=1 Tax=Nocardia amikacinitolerans TaxID=756689 RepID=A0A285LYK0_9NOCA|nr:hypothetical protein [Nocardia amikacinitolerans]SNY88401.1 hypothetical protein SAMN04244553_5373 [Nocardia amikacinitolerans]